MNPPMRTQITLDDQLIQQAIEISGVNSPQILIEMVLREFVKRQKSDLSKTEQLAGSTTQLQQENSLTCLLQPNELAKKITLQDLFNKPATGQRSRVEIDDHLASQRNDWEN